MLKRILCVIHNQQKATQIYTLSDTVNSFSEPFGGKEVMIGKIIGFSGV